MVGKHSSEESPVPPADAALNGGAPPHSETLSRLFEEHNRAFVNYENTLPPRMYGVNLSYKW